MAKQSGLGDNAYVGGYDLSGDVAALSTIRGGPTLLEVTAINSSAHERIGGKRDGEISFETFFNDDDGANRAGGAGSTFVVLSALPTTDVQVMYLRGTTLGNVAAAMIAKQMNYDWARGTDGSLMGTVQALANAYGLNWCRILTAGIRTDTEATEGDGVDDGAANSTGIIAYLQVFSFTGTDATVKIQESSDDGDGDAYADVVGGGFTEITEGPTTERIATASDLSVEQWLRAVTVTSEGFSSMEFAVAYYRLADEPE